MGNGGGGLLKGFMCLLGAHFIVGSLGGGLNMLCSSNSSIGSNPTCLPLGFTGFLKIDDEMPIFLIGNSKSFQVNPAID